MEKTILYGVRPADYDEDVFVSASKDEVYAYILDEEIVEGEIREYDYTGDVIAQYYDTSAMELYDYSDIDYEYLLYMS